MKNRILLSVVLVSLLAVVAGCPPVQPPVVEPVVPPVEVFEWKFQSLWPAGVLNWEVFVDFTERVKELSGGQLIITPFSDGAIVGRFEKFDAVRVGLLSGMDTFAGDWTGIDPAFQVFASIPAGFTDRYQYEAWFWEGGGIELARELAAKYDLHVIGVSIYGPEFKHMKEPFPVHTKEDLSGRIMRFPPGIQVDVMAAMGVSVVILPGGEVYTALAKGVLEGAEFSTLATNYDLGWHEVTKWIIKPSVHQPTTALLLVVGMDEWEALPADLQAIVEAASREFSEELFARNLVESYRALASMLAHGNEVIVLPEAEVAKMREVAMAEWERWAAKSPMSRRVWDSYLDFMRLLGLIE
jgi:TRAP-type mannitol/chloroaromatic compound transport system substrate-binding protein